MSQLSKGMKRLGNIFQEIISLENLVLAEKKARKGKSSQYGVQLFDKNADENLLKLNQMLSEKTFQTSTYKVFPVYEPKERLVYQLPYFPDRIVHHAIMNKLEKMFNSVFTADSYSCIKGRGIHGAFYNLKTALKDKENTKYCLKIDIVKFYPNVNHEVLKTLIRKKIKDQDLLWLLDEIIDSADGLPIGNYLSQYFANFYLTYFDHWLKEVKKVKYYYRYADDIVILSSNKPELHKLLEEMNVYLSQNLKLKIKDNYQVFPVEKRGIDFIGYVFFHTHILIRKSIKQSYARAISKNKPAATLAAYNGWLMHANTTNLINKLQPNERYNKEVFRLQSKTNNQQFYRRQNTDAEIN